MEGLPLVSPLKVLGGLMNQESTLCVHPGAIEGAASHTLASKSAWTFACMGPYRSGHGGSIEFSSTPVGLG